MTDKDLLEKIYDNIMQTSKQRDSIDERLAGWHDKLLEDIRNAIVRHLHIAKEDAWPVYAKNAERNTKSIL